jgi:hypothetical protein
LVETSKFARALKSKDILWVLDDAEGLTVATGGGADSALLGHTEGAAGVALANVAFEIL